MTEEDLKQHRSKLKERLGTYTTVPRYPVLAHMFPKHPSVVRTLEFLIFRENFARDVKNLADDRGFNATAMQAKIYMGISRQAYSKTLITLERGVPHETIKGAYIVPPLIEVEYDQKSGDRKRFFLKHDTLEYNINAFEEAVASNSTGNPDHQYILYYLKTKEVRKFMEQPMLPLSVTKTRNNNRRHSI